MLVKDAVREAIKEKGATFSPIERDFAKLKAPLRATGHHAPSRTSGTPSLTSSTRSH